MRHLLAGGLVSVCVGLGQTAPDEAREGLRNAVSFYAQEVATEGGYHFAYASDLSYGRSESAEGPTQISVQRAGTPGVGIALVEAFGETGEPVLLEAAVAAARALVRGQHCTGGWDYIIEFEESQRDAYPYRLDGDCAGEHGDRDAYPGRRYTTLDDNVTQGALRLLMRVDAALAFEDAAIHEAATYAMDRLMEAQYANGAWPQRYDRMPDPERHQPLRASYPESWQREWPGDYYRNHYTLNDNSLADMIDAFLEAARIYEDERYLAAAERGGSFLLRAQMPDPQPAWAQQYDADMHPAWARVFEPPSISGGEVRSVLRILLTLYRETGKEKYLEPIPRALEYFRNSYLPPAENSSARRRRTCPPPEPCLARFYELRTNRPLFITKGTQVRVAGRSTIRDDGYKLSYSDNSTIQHYALHVNGRWVEEIAAEYEQVKAASAEARRRPVRLSGLSPWSQPFGADEPTVDAGEAARLLAAMDERGAWPEDGTIGKADRVVSVTPAEAMVVVIDGKAYPLPEDSTVTVYRGTRPPVGQIIDSETFARNIRVLARYVGHP